MTTFTSIASWEKHIEALHAIPIDLGLDRMYKMIEALSIDFQCPVITVAGTNGKGSTCAMLESIYRQAGFRVGTHTSPHLLRINERARVDGLEVTDEALMQAFERVEKARGEMTLSYFEYTTLAVLTLFNELKLDVVILEVGLGGRLDAINALEPTVSVITSIGIDHVQFLGHTREAIGLEKAHIFRKDKRAISADEQTPMSVIDYAKAMGAHYAQAGKDFSVTVHEDGSFDFEFEQTEWRNLPAPGLVGENQYRNAAGVLAVVSSLKEQLPTTADSIASGLASVRLRARFELVSNAPRTVLDVGHNPHAAKVLVKNIALTRLEGEETWAVFGMLADKDMLEVSRLVNDSFDRFYIASLGGPRGASADQLKSAMLEAGVDEAKINQYAHIKEALESAQNAAKDKRNVRLIIFGSFVTIIDAMAVLKLH